MKKFLVGAIGLVAGWMWSRGHRDPRRWPSTLPGEISKLWDDLDDAFGTARRENSRRQQAFDDELDQVRSSDT